MPVEDHPVFNQPGSDAKLWRYMDLPKFTNLLTSKSLWLASAKTLAEDDAQEGALLSGNFGHRAWKSEADVPKDDLDKIHKARYGRTRDDIGYKIEREKQNRENWITQNVMSRHFTYISCWYHDQAESAAMWKIYGAPGPGLAITTTVERLKKAVRSARQNMQLGSISYVDPASYVVDTDNGFSPYLVKRQSYSYEREVRLVYWDTSYYDGMPMMTFDPQAEFFKLPSPSEVDAFLAAENAPPGIRVDCNIDNLIDEVWISPTSPSWYDDTIRKLLGAFEINSNVVRSALRTSPMR